MLSYPSSYPLVGYASTVQCVRLGCKAKIKHFQRLVMVMRAVTKAAAANQTTESVPKIVEALVIVSIIVVSFVLVFVTTVL